MFEVVSKELFAEEIGVTPGTVDGWMRRDWTRGCEYVVKGHTTLIYIEEARQMPNRRLVAPNGYAEPENKARPEPIRWKSFSIK